MFSFLSDRLFQYSRFIIAICCKENNKFSLRWNEFFQKFYAPLCPKFFLLPWTSSLTHIYQKQDDKFCYTTLPFLLLCYSNACTWYCSAIFFTLSAGSFVFTAVCWILFCLQQCPIYQNPPFHTSILYHLVIGTHIPDLLSDFFWYIILPNLD